MQQVPVARSASGSPGTVVLGRRYPLYSLMAASESVPTDKKLDELYDLIGDIETPMMTTRRPDGGMSTRPMATQTQAGIGDLHFVTDIDSTKVAELRGDAHVSLGYFDPGSYEWVAVAGRATVMQDRAKIEELYQPDWRAWFGDEGGARDGSATDPRLALIVVDAESVSYMRAKHSKPVALFQIAKGAITGEQPDLGRTATMSDAELPS